MSDQVAIRIADAVVVEINAAVTAAALETVGFTAVRRYPDWPEDFEDANDLRVDVVYSPNEDEPVGMHSEEFIEHKPTINIVVRKRFGTSDRENSDGRLKNSSVDPLIYLIDQLRKLFIADRRGTTLTEETTAIWEGRSQVKSWYDASRLRSSMFEGYVQVQFSMRETI